MTTKNDETQTQIAHYQPKALATGFDPASLEEAERLAQTLSKSMLMPDALKGKPADVLVTILTGRELGLSPMQSIRGMHVIKGKAVASADLMVALCKRSPECVSFRLVESTDKRATYEAQRRGDPSPTSLSWTIEQAQAAGLLSNDNWKKHPPAMLRARCAAALARVVFPDLVMGVYDEDEGREMAAKPAQGYRAPPKQTTYNTAPIPTSGDESPALDAEFVDAPGEPPESSLADLLIQAFDEVETTEQQKEIVNRYTLAKRNGELNAEEAERVKVAGKAAYDRIAVKAEES